MKTTKCLLLTHNIAPIGEHPGRGCNFCFSSGRAEQKKSLQKINYRNENYTPRQHMLRNRFPNTSRLPLFFSLSENWQHERNQHQTDAGGLFRRKMLPVKSWYQQNWYSYQCCTQRICVFIRFFKNYIYFFIYLRNCFCFLPLLFHPVES